MNSRSSTEPPEDTNESYTKEQMDWYFPGRSEGNRLSPETTSDTAPPSQFHAMIQKFHIGTSLAALLLFFLPWIDIQCSGTSFATQTGIQTIYGGGSPSEEMKAFDDENRKKESREAQENESMGYSILVALAFLAVIGAVVFSFRALRSGAKRQSNLVEILCAAAFLLLSVQMLIGFPVKRNLGKGLAEEAAKSETSGNPMDGMGSEMAAAMMMSIQVKHLPALYFVLIFLGLPTLVLGNRLIDKMKET